MTQREIKFRAWQRNLKEMHDIVAIDWKGQWISYGVAWWNLRAYDLMQYTGLKDKNGKEIYEGDILLQEGTGFRFEVEFVNSAWRCSKRYLPNELGLIEVIGNIYENPELIK